MEAIDAIMTRRSVRKFEKRQIPDEIIARIIRAGTYAPSALALQPWAFVVVQDQTFLNKVSDGSVKLSVGDPHELQNHSKSNTK